MAKPKNGQGQGIHQTDRNGKNDRSHTETHPPQRPWDCRKRQRSRSQEQPACKSVCPGYRVAVDVVLRCDARQKTDGSAAACGEQHIDDVRNCLPRPEGAPELDAYAAQRLAKVPFGQCAWLESPVRSALAARSLRLRSTPVFLAVHANSCTPAPMRKRTKAHAPRLVKAARALFVHIQAQPGHYAATARNHELHQARRHQHQHDGAV